MATSLANPNISNIQVGTWTNVYSLAPVGGFSDKVRIVVEATNGKLKLTNTGTSVTPATGYGDLYNGSATSIAFEGTLTQVNNALQSLQALGADANANVELKVSAVRGGQAYNPATGHYYEFVAATDGISWNAAKVAASAKAFNGLKGYLVTITSAEEQAFVASKSGGKEGWIGASDANIEGTFQWYTGPEGGPQPDGSTPYTTIGIDEGATFNNYINNSYRYHNFASGEPNDYQNGNPGEDYVYMRADGTWNDYNAANTSVKGYLVEYGGYSNDNPTEVARSTSSTLTVVATPVISSNGGGATASINYAENGTAAVTTVTATDADSSDTKTYSIAGGADASSFDINSSTGVLTFKTSPNFEAPTDTDTNNSYQVTVRVTDSPVNGQTRYDEQTLTINVTNVNDLPITSGSLPASIETTEEASVAVDLSALGFSDQDPSDTFTLKLAASKGTLTATGADGVTVVGSGSNTLTLTGTPTAVTAFLDTASNIHYTGALNDNGSPAATIAVSYKDSAMASFQALDSAIAVNITAVNDAPVIASPTTAAILPGINEDESSTTNMGATVNSLFVPRFTDVDSGDKLSGIVVVGNASIPAEGTWEYSTDSGTSWHAIGTVSTNSGLALAATTKLRFAPADNWNGTPGALTVKLLDSTYQASFTSDTTPATLDTTAIPASSAVSTNAVNLTTSVAAVNDLPTFTSIPGTASLTETAAFDDNVTTVSGALTGTLKASDVEDSANVTYGIRGGSTSDNTVTKVGFYGTLTLDTSTKAWTYTPSNFTAINALNEGQTATDVFDFSITDSAAATASQALTITYTGTNDTPLVKAGTDPIPDQKFNGTGSWSYQIPADIFTDADGTNLTYTVEVVDGSGKMIDIIGVTAGGDASKPSNWLIFNEASRTLSGTPTETAPLPLNIRVTASDGAVSVSDTFTVTGDESATTSALKVTPLDDKTLSTLSGEWSFATGDIFTTAANDKTITYSATLADGSALPSWLNFDAASHTFSGNPPAGLPYLNLKVIGTDTTGATGFTTFTLNLADASSGAAAANTPGAVSISGSATLGATLTAATPTDADGMTSTVHYQWQASKDGTKWTDIGGPRAQGSTFTITQAESNQQLRVQAFYNDAGGFAEAPVSDAITVPKLLLAGAVTINGSLQPGQTLVASLSDGSGLAGVTPIYQWYRGDTSGAETTPIGGNFSAYTLSNDDGGKFITVRVTYTDYEGTSENVSGSSGQIQLGAEPPKAVNDTGTATEAGGLNNATAGSNASGNVLGNDTDLNTADTKAVTGVRTGINEGLGDAAVLAEGAYTLAGTYGTLSITASTGAYTYTVNQTAANVQALTAGQQVTDVFNYTVTDSTLLSDVGLLTITLTGVDDTLEVRNLPATFTVTEDVTMALDFGSSFNLSDPDFPGDATVTLEASEGTLSGTSALGVTVSGSATGTLTLVGTLGNISTWLKTIGSVQYTSALDDSGTPGATVVVKLAGNTLGTANINITPVNDAPVISSNGGGATASIDYAENGTTAVTTVTATDPDSGDTKTFSISGGDDADLFRINASTGALTFRNSPNYEVPADADNNNTYIVTVKVTDAAGLMDEQTLTINVTDDATANDPIEAGGAGSHTITAPADNAKINVTGSGTTTITNPAGSLTIANSGSGTVVVQGLNDGATVNTSGTGATKISDPEGSLTVANSGTGTVTVDGLNTGSVLSTTGSGPTAVTNPDGNLSVANNGTGTVTVGGLNSGASLTANGTGPTQVNDPEGHLTVNNSGSGVVTVDGLNTGSGLTTTGTGPTAVTNPDGNLEVANNGTGTVTVNGLNPGASLTASGTGPTQINDPEGHLTVNNSGSGTVTVNGLNTDSVLTTTGIGPTTVANPDGNLSVANNGTGTVTVNGLNPNASLSASGSGPTLVENPDASLIVANSGTGTVTVNGLNTGGVLTTTGSGPTAVTNPDGSLAVANNGTGKVTVNGLNPNASLTANGTGPTLVNDPEGNLTVSNSGSGTVTVAGLNDDAVLNSNGTGPIRVTDPDDDVSVVNNGSGTVSVDGMKGGAVLSSSGTGPVTISNPEGNLRVANTGTGTVTVEDLKPGAILTATGTKPVNVDLSHLSSGQTITIDNDGSGVVNLVNVPEGVTVLTTGSSGSGGINYAPTITDVPAAAQGVTAGTAAALADFKVADKDASQTLTVTLKATNGTVGGLTDADTNTDGIQLTGTADAINTALAGATFTAAGAGAASIAISVTDGVMASPATAMYSLTSTISGGGGEPPPPPPAPAPVVDGVPVVTTPGGGGTTIVTIPVVLPTRPDDPNTPNPDLADIPLVSAPDGRPIVLASLPVGFGLSASTSGISTAGNSLTDLIRDIQQHTAAGSQDQSQMTSGATDFLGGLPSTTPLLVQTIVPTFQGSGTPGQALGISGQPAPPGGPLTALVIDASGLPPSTSLQLNNVEFAAIIGAVSVSGGAGSQHVWGDSASQTIFLGADDDVLHGGGGNDTVGSLGGNDQVFGDAGDDIVFGGTGHDTLSGGTGNDRLDGGLGWDTALQSGSLSDYTLSQAGNALLLTHKTTGEVDHLKSVEMVKFDTGTSLYIADSDAEAAIAHIATKWLGRDLSAEEGAEFQAYSHLTALEVAQAVLRGPYGEQLQGHTAEELIAGWQDNPQILRMDVVSEVVQGSTGVDAINYGVKLADAHLQWVSNGVWEGTSRINGDMVELHNIERLHLNDASVALDGANLAALIAVTLGEASLQDRAITSEGLALMDNGWSHQAIGAAALKLAMGAGTHTAEDTVQWLWTKAYGSAGTTEQLQPYVQQLQSGATTVGDLAWEAAQYAQANPQVGLAGVQQQGLVYDAVVA